MISLIGEDFTIKIEQDNPIYKTIKKFSGETVLIYGNPENKKNENLENEKIPQVFVNVNNEDVFKEFYSAYPQLNSDNEDDDKIPVWLKLLENHIFQILGAKNGITKLEKTEENLFKKGELYLLMPSHLNK
jgi:hypothetical protein